VAGIDISQCDGEVDEEKVEVVNSPEAKLHLGDLFDLIGLLEISCFLATRMTDMFTRMESVP